MCDQQSLRSACTYMQSDQSLCLSLEYSMTVNLLTEDNLESQSLKGGCIGSSESTLVKMPHCWKSHATSQMCLHELRVQYHGHQSSSFIVKCIDTCNKFMRVTSYSAEAGLDSCKKQCVLLFYYQLHVLALEMSQKSENAFPWLRRLLGDSSHVCKLHRTSNNVCYNCTQLLRMLGTVALDQQACLFKLHRASVHVCSTCTRPAAQPSMPQSQQSY